MGLDVRLPIGLMFVTIGMLLVGYGMLAADTSGASMNAWWGLMLLAVGALMLWLALRSARARRTEEMQRGSQPGSGRATSHRRGACARGTAAALER